MACLLGAWRFLRRERHRYHLVLLSGSARWTCPKPGVCPDPYAGFLAAIRFLPGCSCWTQWRLWPARPRNLRWAAEVAGCGRKAPAAGSLRVAVRAPRDSARPAVRCGRTARARTLFPETASAD